MSNLSYYLQCAANDTNREILKRQHKEQQDGAITCAGCDWRRALTMAYRCLYCGLYFCHPCAETHFGMTVQDWIVQRRQERRRQLDALMCYLGEGI